MTDRIVALTEAYRAARAALAFLDVNLWLGRPRAPEFAHGFDLATLEQRLARYQIQGGVVTHFASLTYNPQWGNAELLRTLAGQANEEGRTLWGGLILVPEQFTVEAEGRAYLRHAVGQGARLARLFPKTHNFTLRAWCSGALLHALEDARMPLTLWHTETSWDELRTLCTTYPKLPVIIEGTPQKILYHTRSFTPLLEQCPNLYLELHNLVNYLGIEALVQRFGAGRLLFGSYMPVYDPNATLMQVTHARIAPADKARLARENLAELLAEVQAP